VVDVVKRLFLLGVVVAVAVTACSSTSPTPTAAQTPITTTPAATTPPAKPKPHSTALPGMPPVTNPHNIYAAAGAGMLSRAVRGQRSLVYVPNLNSNTVSVIDPRTYHVIDTFAVGRGPQHVVPSYDLKTLWVNNDLGNSLTPINPRTGKPGKAVPVSDPYNLYFTPNGKFAMVMAERLRRIDFRDPHTMALRHTLSVPDCAGVNHVDFSADGRYFIATCEFNGRLIEVDTEKQKVVGEIQLPGAAKPQDVKLSPDGKVFYVADMITNGVWEVTGKPFKTIGFVSTGRGAHGLYPSRDAKYLYVSNRGEGSISVISFATRKVVKTWRLPGGGSPDMGNVSVNGDVLWLSGRYNGVVYVINTHDGHLIARIPVGSQPHGLCVWPQPGRYSLGHTGVMR
jgi:YVTN family beta-propeller protein